MKDQLIIDNMVLDNCKWKLTNLAIGLTDYKKTHDMLPLS